MRYATLLFLVVLTGIVTATQVGADQPPADKPIAEVIDSYVNQKLKAAKVSPAPRADDATLVRRLYLDLAGRIPTPAEARAFVESKDSTKYAKLAAELLASPEFIRHNATEFDVMLANDNAEAGSVRAYLLEAFRENRPWDQMFRELVGASEKSPSTKPEQYVAKRLKDRDSLTRDVSSVFFGLNITCAQCHKHPYISSLTQDYFFGMREFFAASYEIQGNLVERKFVKAGDFKAKSGKAVPVKMMFLDGSVVEREATANLDKAMAEESKAIQEFTKNFAKTKQLPPEPAFRARVKLAEVALNEKNRERFAQAIVNRLWYRFYGHGLVMRVDQLHANNPASYPELLAWLARDLIAHKYDLKRLIAGLVSSETYARSSQWTADATPSRELFAVAPLRPLTPMQWATSFGVANDPALLKAGQSAEAREKALTALEKSAAGIAKLLEYPREGMQISTTEAMSLSNDAGIQKSVGSGLIPSLLKIKDRKEQITEAAWTVLSRPPSESELALFDAYLEKRKDRPGPALQQVLWAMINGAEFRFNH